MAALTAEKLILIARHVMVVHGETVVDPNMAEQNGHTALIVAARGGHASVVTLLLADERVDPNMASQSGSTAYFP